MIDGKAIYGAFLIVPGAGKIGVGLAMENFDANIRIQFSSHAQGSNALQRNVRGLLRYSPCWPFSFHQRLQQSLELGKSLGSNDQFGTKFEIF